MTNKDFLYLITGFLKPIVITLLFIYLFGLIGGYGNDK